MPFKFSADLGWLKLSGDEANAEELAKVIELVSRLPMGATLLDEASARKAVDLFMDKIDLEWIYGPIMEMPEFTETVKEFIRSEIQGSSADKIKTEIGETGAWVAGITAIGDRVNHIESCIAMLDQAVQRSQEIQESVAKGAVNVPTGRLTEIKTEEDLVTEEPEPEPEPEIPANLLPAEPAPEPEKPTQLGNPVPFPDGANLPWRCQLVLKHIKAGLTIEEACEVEGWKQSTALQYLSETRKRLKRPDIAFAKSQRQAPARSGPLKVAWEKVVQVLSEAAEGKTPLQISEAMGTSIFALSESDVVQVLDRYSVTLAKMRAAWGRDPVSFREAKLEAQARVINDSKDGKVVFGP